MITASERHPAFEEYCECIFELHEDDLDVIRARIAERLNVSRASVSQMIEKMTRVGLVTSDDNTIALTRLMMAGILDEFPKLKLVCPQQGLIPESLQAIDFERFLPKPMDSPPRMENTRLAVDYCKANPRWRLSLHTH